MVGQAAESFLVGSRENGVGGIVASQIVPFGGKSQSFSSLITLSVQDFTNISRN